MKNRREINPKDTEVKILLSLSLLTVSSSIEKIIDIAKKSVAKFLSNSPDIRVKLKALYVESL